MLELGMFKKTTGKIHPKYWYLLVIITFLGSTLFFSFQSQHRQQTIDFLFMEKNQTAEKNSATTA